jgi:hypothetical protein
MRVLIGCAAVLIGAAGCSGDGRVGVEGAVSYAGEPVGVGTITFLPAGEEGVKAGGRIADGRYALEPRFGLKPGTHRVEIRWAKPTGRRYKNEFGEEFDRTAEGLPDKYHAQTTLTAEVRPGANVIDFHLER